MRLRVLPALLLAVNACASPGAGSGTSTTAAALAANAVVAHVADGDTIDVRIDGAVERVRLIGIDTPETHKPDTPVECYGPEATARTAALLPLGTAVRLERDVEPRDPYARLLAYVYRASDGLFVNLALAREGFARPLSIAPNTVHAADIGAAADDARAAGRGLWAACTGPT